MGALIGGKRDPRTGKKSRGRAALWGLLAGGAGGAAAGGAAGGLGGIDALRGLLGKKTNKALDNEDHKANLYYEAQRNGLGNNKRHWMEQVEGPVNAESLYGPGRYGAASPFSQYTEDKNREQRNLRLLFPGSHLKDLPSLEPEKTLSLEEIMQQPLDPEGKSPGVQAPEPTTLDRLGIKIGHV